jgi:glycosyltransferase involved in cell wall biosynthesis
MAAERALRIIHSEAATSFGGQEHRIYKEMIAMRERGHYLEAICQPDAELTPRLRDAGFVVHTLYMDGIVNIARGISQLAGVLRQGHFDVLNTHSRQDTLIAAAAGRIAGVPLIVRTRHLASKIGSLLTYNWLPHRVSTVSEYVRRQVIARGVPTKHVETIYTGVVLAPPVQLSTLRAELGLKETDVVVGCVAVMRPNKGHMRLLDAIEPILRTRSDVHLVLVGGGSPLFEEISTRIEQAGLKSQIHLLGTRKDVPNLLAGFDLFALATQQEALGTVFVEAAASGLAVIGTDVGGVGEMMVPGQTGLLVPAKDSAALTKALQTLIEAPELRKKMGRSGQDRIWKEGIFTTERLAQRTEDVYSNWLTELREKTFLKGHTR